MKSNLQNLFLLISIGVWLLPLTSCVPEDSLQNLVVTEDVIYLSGSKVRLSGRVIEITGNVDDHGFYISPEQSFISPIIVSLSEKSSGLGRFVGAYDFLTIGTKYYYKSYANIDGNVVFGQEKVFSTLRPRADLFSPNTGKEGSSIIITGINFTDDTKVFFGSTEVPIISLENESTLEVKAPVAIDKAAVEIKVVVQDTTMVFEDKFTYFIGKWNLETKFLDNTQLYESMFLIDGNEFIVGLGKDIAGALNTNIWSLNLDSYSWTNLNFPTPEATALSPFNAGGYWGTGLVGFLGGGSSPYFWRYSLGNFELKPFLTFRLYKSVGMVLEGDLYVFGGDLEDQPNNTLIYRFEELSNSWTVWGESPYVLSSTYPYFSHNSKAYFLLPDGRIIRYEPSSDQWDEVGTFPSNVGDNGIAIELNSKVLIGLFSQDRQLWEWEISSNTWTQKSDFSGNLNDGNTGYFSYLNKAYFFRTKNKDNSFDMDPKMELWSLDPTKF